MHIMEQIAIEKREERAIGPNTKCQVIVGRDLFKKWKQPIYYLWATAHFLLEEMAEGP